MRITVVRTSATTADVTDLTPLAPAVLLTRDVSQVVVVARPALPRHRRRVQVGRRHRVASRTAGSSAAGLAGSELVEVTIVRSSRNRVGGGARARPLA